MKYLHVVPPWYAFHGNGNLRQPNVPLGAAYCARAALSAGWDTLIWNGDLLPTGVENQFSEEMDSYKSYLENSMPQHKVWEDYIQVLLDFKPDVIGITALTASYPSALRCARVAKSVLGKDLRIVLGGPHPSAMPARVEQQQDVDYVIAGEGESQLYHLLQRISGNVPRDGGTPESPIGQLDDLGWPARGKVIDRYGLLKQDHYGLVMFSRGCPYRCAFCASSSLWGKTTRWRSPDDLANEMVAIHKEYDTRYFSMQDDTFTLNYSKVIDLCKCIIARGLPSVPGFRWTCNTRPELINPVVLGFMKEAGCSAVAVGIEFGSARILEKVQKRFTTDDVRLAIKLIKDAGLISSGQFMVGYPTETPEEMWETVRLAEELECESVMLSVATPLPNTPLYNEAVSLGLIGENPDWAKVTTKNDGMLMTVADGKGGHISMPAGQRNELLASLFAAFNEIQNKKLEEKNAARLRYEKEYLPGAAPVYGVKK